MHILRTHLNVWKLIAINTFQETFINRWTNLLFMLGKTVRFAVSLLFLYLIKEQITIFAGYTPDQMIVFFLTYQFVDVLAQVFYRGVYIFSYLIRTGQFDYYLAKPINPLFRSLTGKPDINDTIFIIPTTIISIFILASLDLNITFTSVALYLVLLLNSFLIATALHILVLVIGILTTEVDGVIWIYRDLMRMGQFPVTIYLQPLRWALFFLIPIGTMITIPAQVLIGRPPEYTLILVSAIGVGSLLLSLKLWSWSLRRYSSASS